MEITTQNLTALFTAFDLVFQQGYQEPPTYYEKIATIAPSTSRQTVYPWMGRTTQFSEWLGDRTLQALMTHGYTIVNRNFEDTVEVDRNDLEDDTYGVYEPLFRQLGWDARVHPDTLIFGLLKQAVQYIDSANAPSTVICYDGHTFFSQNHPGPTNNPTQLQSNVITSGSGPWWFLIDASRPIRPLVFQKRREYTVTRMDSVTDEAVFNRRAFRFGVDARVNAGFGLWQLAGAANTDLSQPANYAALRALLRSIKTEAGLPFGSLAGNPDKIYLLVPPALEGVARILLHGEMTVGPGAASAVPTTNIWRNSAQLIVSEYLS